MKRILSFVCLLLLAGAARAQMVVAATVACATSTDGTVVGVLNPLNPPQVSVGFSGTLPAGNYFTQIAWYDAAGHVTLVSPEVQRQLTGTGSLTVQLPTSGKPAAAAGMKVYIGATSGSETLQGQTTGGAVFTQSTPLTSGAAEPTTNTTICAIVANDAGWPTGTGYTVAMTTPAGNTIPGYPMQWQLLGPGTTYNLANGLPLYNGTVTYPVPLLARPVNHAPQSISGPLYLTNYTLAQIGALGVGTQTPGFPVDVENGSVNASGGYIYNGGIGVSAGDCLVAGSDTYHTYVPGTCYTPPTPTTVFYQTFDFNSTPATQAAVANFSQRFGFTNVTNVTNVDLNAPGTGNMVATETANPGTSSNCATYDGSGNLVPTGQPCFNGSATLRDYYWTVNSCSVGSSQPNSCTGTTNLPGNMPDTSYQVFCSTNDNPSSGVTGFSLCALRNNGTLPTSSATSMTYETIQVIQGSPGGSRPVLYFHAHHS